MSTVSCSPRAVHRRIRTATAVVILGVALSCVEASAASAEPSVEELSDRLETSSQELEVIVEDYNQVAQELEDLEAHHQEVGDSIAPLQTRAARATEELGDIAAALYRGGQTVTVTPLLDGRPETLADRLAVLDYLSLDQANWYAELAETRQVLESEELQIDDLASQRAALKAEKSDKEAEITDAMAELDLVRAQAVGAGYRGAPMLAAPAIPGGDAGSAATALRFANGAIGAPYQWGGTGPGFDCSGLTSAAWGAAGVNLPHNSQSQYNSVARVGRDELQPGDLVFYYDDLHHVALYAGEGKIIHAPTEGQAVRVSAIDEMPVAGYGRPA